MHVNLLFPNQYLCAADLRGRDVTLTIDVLRSESLKTSEGEEPRWVLHFVEMRNRPGTERKRLVLNKTNAKTIAQVYGTETDNWKGKRITLFATTCQAFGQTVECIRVRPRQPAKPTGKAAPAAERQPGEDDDIDPTVVDAP